MLMWVGRLCMATSLLPMTIHSRCPMTMSHYVLSMLTRPQYMLSTIQKCWVVPFLQDGVWCKKTMACTSILTLMAQVHAHLQALQVIKARLSIGVLARPSMVVKVPIRSHLVRVPIRLHSPMQRGRPHLSIRYLSCAKAMVQ